MDKNQKYVDAENERLSVEKIEAKLKSHPKNIGLKEDLAYALVDRCHYGEGDLLPENEPDVERIRELLTELPEDKVLFPRAYLAYVDHKEEDVLDWLVKHASYNWQGGQTPLTCDELYDDFVTPFSEASKEFWRGLAEALNQIWPDSAAVLTLRGLEKIDDNNPREAIDYFVRALSKDADYWWAAWLCADSYAIEKNWKAALGYYYKALKAESAQELPDIHFELAWCLGKLKRYEEEEQQYCICLELDPDNYDARNNLAWSLVNQHRYEEALNIFEESIKRGEGWKQPFRNKAEMLTKLGRLTEAIETYQQCRQNTPQRSLPKWAADEISRLETMLEKQGQLPILCEASDEPNDEERDIDSDERKELPAISKLKGKSYTTSAQTEKLLEEMLEKSIQRGDKVFGRELRMYDPPEGPYGRQYAISEVGRIDLLVEDIETSDLIVIELKRNESDDQVVGQISRYMTWVRENLVKEGQKTFGIICVFGASNKLLLAAKNIVGLEVFEYSLTFCKV